MMVMDILFLFVGNSGSNGIKPTDEFLAIEPCHLDMLNLFEGRIEATRIVAHFHQTVDIDDKALAHLYKTRVEGEQCFTVDVTFQAYGFFTSRHNDFPDSLVTIVVKESDVGNGNHSKVREVGIENQFFAVAPYSTVDVGRIVVRRLLVGGFDMEA